MRFNNQEWDEADRRMHQEKDDALTEETMSKSVRKRLAIQAPVVKSLNPSNIRKDLKARKETQALELIDAHVRSYTSLWDLFLTLKRKHKEQSEQITKLEAERDQAVEYLEKTLASWVDQDSNLHHMAKEFLQGIEDDALTEEAMSKSVIKILAVQEKVKYDSREATRKHIYRVGKLLSICQKKLFNKASVHDQSKLESPEKEIFDIYTPKLKGVTYGSDEYKEYMSEMKVAIDHHNKNNRHHPEHFVNGISGMNLMDLTELICDWKAASERHDDGDVYKSIEINQERFGYSDELKSIFKNTLDFLKGVEQS